MQSNRRYVALVSALIAFAVSYAAWSLLSLLATQLRTHVVISTICFLVAAVFLGIGSSAVVKFMPQYFAKDAGTMIGLVGGVGRLGGNFPELIMGAINFSLGNYSVEYYLLALTTSHATRSHLTKKLTRASWVGIVYLE